MNDDMSAAPLPSPSDSPSDSAAIKVVSASRPRSRRRRWCWGVIVVGYLFVAYARLGPGDIERNDAGYLFFWYVAFLARTFQFHAGVVFALLTAICLIARWNRPALAAVPILLATLGPTARYYTPRTMKPPTGETFRVMSANLLYLNDVYQPIIDEILEVDPDVLLLQEYTDQWHQAMRPALSEAYPHAVWVTRSDAFGLAIYAKQPMEPDPRRQLDCGSLSLPLLRAVVEANGQRIAFYSVHMVPPTWRNLPLMRRQFRALRDRLASDARTAAPIPEGKPTPPAGKREPTVPPGKAEPTLPGNQGNPVLSEAEGNPTVPAGEAVPVVLAGDFNFTGASHMHRALRALGLVDAHQTAGWGRGDTWPQQGLLRFVPGVRIDHVYLSEELTAMTCRVGRGSRSDHRPIIVDFAAATNHARSPAHSPIHGAFPRQRAIRPVVYDGSSDVPPPH